MIFQGFLYVYQRVSMTFRWKKNHPRSWSILSIRWAQSKKRYIRAERRNDLVDFVHGGRDLGGKLRGAIAGSPMALFKRTGKCRYYFYQIPSVEVGGPVHNWLVVWNIFFYILGIIIPTD
jgi:hypothetical protein